MDDAGFNPYASWLGIEPHECPPSYYRLLEIASFESRLEVIAQAAQNQISFVESKTSGTYEAHARKLLAELTLARNCLLNPAARQAYDSSLRSRTLGGVRPPWPAPNTRPAAAAPQPLSYQPVLPPAAAYQPYPPAASQPAGLVLPRPQLPLPAVAVAAVNRPLAPAAEREATLPNMRPSATSSSHQSSRKGKPASYPLFMLVSIVCGGITGISIALVIANSVNTWRQEQRHQEQRQQEAAEQEERAAAARARTKRKVIIRPSANPHAPQGTKNAGTPTAPDHLRVETGSVSPSRNPE